MIELFHEVSNTCSRITTHRYSTSFSSAIKLLHKDLRKPIYNIYGFVRFADEIVDTFTHNQSDLLKEFKAETFKAIERKISLNPILHSFQQTVNDYNIDHHLIHAFFNSMEADLHKSTHDRTSYEEYIYGSAEVVGLMCLQVFCNGNKEKYEKLKPYAQSLGAAFQKINFLRDLKADYKQLNRMYFPGADFSNFTCTMKHEIEKEIAADFQNAYKGIRMLPRKARFGVYVAYRYYISLFTKIRRTAPSDILEQRIRIPDYAKAFIVASAGIKNKLKLI